MPWEPIRTIEHLIARFENSTLDYKTTYVLSLKPTRYDIAKDVSAFANAFGGAIVVGMYERAGRVERLDGVADVAKLMKEIASALQQYCVPVPSSPEEHAILVSPAQAARLLAPGAAAPTTDVQVVTLNVKPDARGPIGVRPFDDNVVRPIDHAYRFPVRVDDQTRFMDPTELPMWMNSHERRIALRLRAIPERATVRVFGEGDLMTVNLVAVDERQAIAIFSLAGAGEANVPLTHITAVWPEPRDSLWSLRIRGRIFRNDQYAFSPEGAGS